MDHMKSRSEATTKTDGMHDYTSYYKAITTYNPKYIYEVTISKHQKKDYVDESNIHDVISKLKFKNTTLYLIDKVYENSGKYSQLHLHGTALSNKPIYFKENNSILGFRIQWKRTYLNRLKGWHKYCHKEINSKYAQENTLLENFCSKSDICLFDIDEDPPKSTTD